MEGEIGMCKIIQKINSLYRNWVKKRDIQYFNDSRKSYLNRILKFISSFIQLDDIKDISTDRLTVNLASYGEDIITPSGNREREIALFREIFVDYYDNQYGSLDFLLTHSEIDVFEIVTYKQERYLFFESVDKGFNRKFLGFHTEMSNEILFSKAEYLIKDGKTLFRNTNI